MGKGQQAWVQVRTKGQPELRIEVNGQPVRIGRAPDNRIVLHDSFASAQHAELLLVRGKPTVRDLGSSNGTRLNGRPLAPGTPHPLQDGDVLQIGTSELTYHLAPAPSRAPQHPPAGPLPAGPPPGATPTAPGSGFWAGARRALLKGTLLLILVAVVVLGAATLLAPARVSLLVLGSDARPDELQRSLVGRTDTLLTVVADRSPAAVTMISIPRDLWVQIPGHGEERINAAYALGGPATAKRTAADVLGVPVNRYLVIGLQGVRDVVDAAGGVEIDVPRAIHDETYPTDDYGTMVLDIPAGRQHMDGETALRYARTRHQDSDFGRMERQQQVMVALRTRLLSPLNWWRLPAVLAAVRQATRTDLGLTDLPTLALAFGRDGSSPERLTLDLTLTEEFRGGGGAFLLRARPELKQRVAVLLNPASAGVEVLNGSGVEGRARQAAETLRSRDVRVVNIGDAPRQQASTTVEVCPGCKRAGALAASVLGLPSEAVQENALLPDGIDVRVTLGGTGAPAAGR